MIMYACHYCGEPMLVPCAPHALLELHTCKACNKQAWLLHSRIYPMSFDVDDYPVADAVKVGHKEDGSPVLATTGLALEAAYARARECAE